MVFHNIDLKPLHTFGISATADTLVTIADTDELTSMLPTLQQADNLLILGGGSNTVFTNNYHGTIVHMANTAIRYLRQNADGRIIVEADAGVVWHHFVQHCIANRWYGLENLTAIPGTVGAAPVQNVGAYGADASQFVHRVHAVELSSGKHVVFANDECHFGYRSSIFKEQAFCDEVGKGRPTMSARYIVTSVEFALNPLFTPNLGYKALSDYLLAQRLEHPTAQQLADAIAALRWSKLPRPEEQGSAGSFFKNPVVSHDLCQRLLAKHPDMPVHKTDNGYKLSAGWLIEQAGWKGRTLGTVGTYPRNALVLCNCGDAQHPCSGDDLRQLAATIANDVEQRFGVTLHPEAIII